MLKTPLRAISTFPSGSSSTRNERIDLGFCCLDVLLQLSGQPFTGEGWRSSVGEQVKQLERVRERQERMRRTNLGAKGQLRSASS